MTKDLLDKADVTATTSPSRRAKESLSFLATTVCRYLVPRHRSCFLLANFYVGDIEVIPSFGFHNLEVHAYNKKGQEAVFIRRDFN